MIQREKAESLLRLHQPGAALLLPNAWDAASARLFEDAGFPAIGTTSAGIAYAQGYRDGECIGRDAMVQVIARIASAVQVPVTADIEAGYGAAPAEVAKTIQGVIAAGAVGVNLEDSTGEPAGLLYPVAAQAARIAAARTEAQRAGLPLVINARIDTYLASGGAQQARFDETVHRARAYLQAGADSIFVPFVTDASLIQRLVRAIPGPLNILALPGTPVAPELFKLGVARVSIGVRAMLATMGVVRSIARELHEHGSSVTLLRDGYSFAEAQALFTKQG
jgi:2-methylisocitrate lyase-like PEP mutase family enzyme